jgi:hypothetical protein
MIRKLTFPLLAIVSAVALCGCQVLTYHSPGGETFTRAAVGSNVSLSSLDVQSDTNGIRRVTLQGYQNDSTQALSAVTDAAVKAAIGAATK